MSKRSQPEWHPPKKANEPVLKFYNSLTRQKEEFIPLKGKTVTWYSCGPTVYDASHMGHARSYITFDILRRILSDYFGYDVFYVMNITDIDDKIIKRARQNYLYEKYVAENHSLDVVFDDYKQIMEHLNNKITSCNDPEKKQMFEKLLSKLTEAAEQLGPAIKTNDDGRIKHSTKEFILASKEPLSDWLDLKFGHTITDNEIFNDLPKYWEEEFHKDMESLNILKPDVLTRVSEYIPEIVNYITKIIENGLAYVSNESVYFDVATFNNREIHHYAKLVPEAYGDINSLEEGEGDLSGDRIQNEKRSPNDFALWKKSKAGEPSWESPWGKGRPGWHIECSAMASAIFGPTLDIHTGGIDLKFPHHDNEIAQCEAHFGNSEWVKYFLHSGHLTIAGCKMSKSLKNFITIRDALSKYTARQLRFAFLLHSWRDTLDYSHNTMDSAVQTEKVFNEFFLNVQDCIRNNNQCTSISSNSTKWQEQELKLMDIFTQSKDAVHSSLCDNIDTRTSLDVLKELVFATNLYLRDRKPPDSNLLRIIAVYITRILGIFGLIYESPKIGFPSSDCNTSDYESIVMPYLTILSDFRRTIRTQARALNATAILTECDKLRDEILPHVGVRLEDKEGEATAVKLVDRKTLLREKEMKKQIELEKKKEKEERQAALAKARTEKEELSKIPPEEFFKKQTDKYSKFDNVGLPTHDVDGQEISKGQMKKLQKLQQQQAKRYQEYISSHQKPTN